MRSIHRYLLLSLIVALTIGSLLVAGFTYFNAAQEIDELYDKNMQEVATTLQSQIAALNVKAHHVKGSLGPSLNAGIKEEQELLIQVWDKNKTSIYTSHRAISFPFQEQPGAQIISFAGGAWHTYGVLTPEFTIQISQPQKARQHFVREMAMHLLLPLLLLIPVVGVFIWLAVGKSLMPLNDISYAIMKRSATSLEPISEQNIPLEIQPLVQEINELLVRLNTSLEAQRRFTADAAHELRTPLTALQLQLGNVKRAKTDKERDANVAKLQDGIDRAAHVVRQLLALARVEPNATETSTARVDLGSLAREVIKQHIEFAMQKHIDMGTLRNESVILPGNAENLRTLFDNLVSNALRYTPSGGKVNVSTYKDGDDAIIEVQDNGIGIPASERIRIFERFHRVLGTGVEGTGLGLSIAQNIVKQHNGTIDVGHGIDGKGTGFTIRLPLPKTPI